MIKKHKWSCLTAATAWLLDTNEESVFIDIGHDGSTLVDDSVADPAGRKGFHIQEITRLLLFRGKSLTPFQLVPMSMVAGHAVMVGNSMHRAEACVDFLLEAEGLITCGTGHGYDHCVAFSKGLIYDPDDGTETALRLTEGKAIKGLFKEFVDMMDEKSIVPRELWIYA